MNQDFTSMTQTPNALPPLTARQLAALDASGDGGRGYAEGILRDHEQGENVGQEELLYARQILAYWDNLKEVA